MLSCIFSSAAILQRTTSTLLITRNSSSLHRLIQSSFRDIPKTQQTDIINIIENSRKLEVQLPPTKGGTDIRFSGKRVYIENLNANLRHMLRLYSYLLEDISKLKTDS